MLWILKKPKGVYLWGAENNINVKTYYHWQQLVCQEACWELTITQKPKPETVPVSKATDNIMIERFFRSFKWERLYLLYPETVREVKEVAQEYMAHCNYARDHQGLDYVTPSSTYFHPNEIAA